jgi:hypothetical protein
MSTLPYLTAKTLYNDIKKINHNQAAVVEYLKNIKNKYNIIAAEESNPIECSPEYPESYIVNQSPKRFRNELLNSHFLLHWPELCLHYEITSKLRFIYSLINLKKDNLIDLLYQISSHHKSPIFQLDNDNRYTKKIIDFMGLQANEIFKIKIENQSDYTKKKRGIVPNNDTEVASASDSDIDHKENDSKYNKKMLINLSIIIELEGEYPRNLLACPTNKVVVVERYKRFKKPGVNFVCHKNNMIERLKTNKLCLSVWLIKSSNKKKSSKVNVSEWITSLKMGTAYLSDTFPGEKGSLNEFIKDVLTEQDTPTHTHDDNILLFIEKLKEGIDSDYFYAIELNDNRIKKISKKKPKKTTNPKKTKKLRKS